MLFGVCGDAKMASVAAKAGYDFAESTVGGVLKPRESDEAFRAGLAAWREVGIPCCALNCLLPNDLPVTGPAVDKAALRAYLTTTMKRAQEAKVEVIVFGSGGARRIPDGFDAKTAHEQLVSFSGMVASLACNHGVTIVVEPLNKTASNVLVTVAESAALVREVGHPSFRLLVDAHHFMRDDNDYESIVKNGYLLSHAHIATVTTRLAPGGEPCDFGPFFAALAKGGYKGRISIEGKIPNPEADLATALRVMKELAGDGRG